jgi:hypothetical protein
MVASTIRGIITTTMIHSYNVNVDVEVAEIFRVTSSVFPKFSEYLTAKSTGNFNCPIYPFFLS